MMLTDSLLLLLLLLLATDDDDDAVSCDDADSVWKHTVTLIADDYVHNVSLDY